MNIKNSAKYRCITTWAPSRRARSVKSSRHYTVRSPWVRPGTETRRTSRARMQRKWARYRWAASFMRAFEQAVR